MDWRSRTQLITLDISQVDLSDKDYLIPSYSPLTRLESSISAVGILNPPLVMMQDRVYVPILGRRRLQAAVNLGISSVSAGEMMSSLDDRSLFEIAFWDNIDNRPANPATTAYLVKRLLDLFEKRTAAERFFPSLGVSAFGPKIERLRMIGGLENVFLNALAQGHIQEKTAFIFSKISYEERVFVLNVILELGMNSNKAAEITSHFFDLAAFSGEAILDGHGAKLIIDIMATAEPNQEKTERVRSALFALRFPEIAGKQIEFSNKICKYRLTKNVQVKAHQAFESPGAIIEVRTDSWHTADSLLEILSEPKSNKES